MADNVTANAGSGGATFAADDIGGVHYPRTKLVLGADGAADLDLDSGQQTMANSLPVAIASNQSAVPVSDGSGSLTVDNAGTFAVQVDGSALTALQLIDDAVHADDAAFTLGTSKGVMVMGFAGTQSVDANDAAALACDSDGALHIADGGNSITVDNGGTFAVQVDGSALTALQLIDNTIVVDDAAFTPATTSVNMAGFQADEASTDSVDEGDAGAARMTLDRKIIVTPQPHTAGGLDTFRSIDLDETEEDVKTAAGQVYGMWVTNTATATRFVKFYNATAANVTVGTTTPVITIGIPGNSSDDVSGNFGPGGMGIAFSTAICVAATTGVADNDTGAPGANEVIVNIFYK